jgi:hypothetical protein
MTWLLKKEPWLFADWHLLNMNRNIFIMYRVVRELVTRVEQWFAGKPERLHPNIREIGFSILLRHTTQSEEDFRRVFKVFLKGEHLNDRLAALNSIGSINSIKLVREILEDHVMNPETIRTQDISSPLRAIVTKHPDSHVVVPLVREWVIQNWDELHKKLQSSMGLLGSVVQIGFGRSIGQDIADELELWAEGHGLGEAEKKIRQAQIQDCKRPFAQAIESIRTRTAWVKRDAASVAHLVSSNNS